MLLRVGPCEIDCDRRRIIRDGIERPLSPKAFDILVALVYERPKVVDKDELMKRIWPDTFVADANLAVLIGDVRNALGDSAQQPRLIKTHHRVGYSFIGDVTEVIADNTEPKPSFILATGKQRIVLFEGTATVGRDEACDIVLEHPSVSRLHARLIVAGGALTVEDNGSKNGTRLDKVRIEKRSAAKPGQRISFGQVDAIILSTDEGARSTLTTPHSSQS